MHREELRDGNNKVSHGRKEQMPTDTGRKGQSLSFLPRRRREKESDKDRNRNRVMERAKHTNLTC